MFVILVRSLALRLALSLAAVGAFAAAPVQAERRVALVIGNGAYSHVPPLLNPVRDATAIGDALRRLQFEHVTVLKDLGAEALRRALLDFEPRAAGADIAVVYFAGHGIEVDGQNFLIPVDARLTRAAAAELEAIPLSTVTTVLASAQKLRLVILDACRNNPFRPRMADVPGGRKRSIGRGLGRVEPGQNELIAFAATAGTEADDGAGMHSPFTAAVLKHIETPGLEIRLLFGGVRDHVLAATNRQQVPHLYGTLGLEPIYLKPGTTPSAADLEATRRAAEEERRKLEDERRLLEQERKKQAALQPAPGAPRPTAFPPPSAFPPAPPPLTSSQAAWVKLCDKGALSAKDKDGKDLKRNFYYCLTQHERIDANTGMVIVAVGLHRMEIDGQEKHLLKVMVPLGMQMNAGVRVTIIPNDVWGRMQRAEKIAKHEEPRLTALDLGIGLCHAAGCTAEIDATPELVAALKTNAGLVVQVAPLTGSAVALPVPLAGFRETLAGPPVDLKKHAEARKQLMEQIAKRQQELVKELKKQQDDLSKMQPSRR